MGEKTDILPWVQVEVQTRKMMFNMFYSFYDNQSHRTEKSTFVGVTANWSKWIYEKMYHMIWEWRMEKNLSIADVDPHSWKTEGGKKIKGF